MVSRKQPQTLFTGAKTWKQPKRASMEKKKIYIYIYIYIGEGSGNPLLPGKSRGWRSLVGCCPWGH